MHVSIFEKYDRYILYFLHRGIIHVPEILQMNFIQFTRSTCIACVIEYPERLNYRCNVSTEVILTTCLTHHARMHFANQYINNDCCISCSSYR